MGKLTITDWSQIISAGGTFAAAIAALVTTLQNKATNKKIDEERYAMVKPIFIIRGTSEDREISQIEYAVDNIGYERVKNMTAFWDGTGEVSIELKRSYKDDKIDYIVVMTHDSDKKEERHISGNLVLAYTDILGKTYQETVEIFIDSKYYELVEEYSPELRGVVGKLFQNYRF